MFGTEIAFLNTPLFAALYCLAAFCVTALAIPALRKVLPRDHGREYAFNGALSEGKTRGAGIVFTLVFVVFAVAARGFKPEFLIYGALLLGEMLSGYLDDRSEKPWDEYKKGIIDLIFGLCVSLTFAHYNPELLCLNFGAKVIGVNKWLFVGLATLFIWIMINAVNCSDGIDGLCGTLSINTLVFYGALGAAFAGFGGDTVSLGLMIAVIGAYLLRNTEPSTVLMGDAGSRAIGMYLALMALRLGNALFAIPLCLIFLTDGLAGIVKIACIRIFKFNPLKKVLTPVHDHLRKNKNRSGAQVRYIFNAVQVIISVLFVALMLWLRK